MKIKYTRVIDWCNHCPPPKSHGQYPISAYIICDFCGEEARCHKHQDIGMTTHRVESFDLSSDAISICTACHLKDSKSKDPLYPKLVKELEAAQRCETDEHLAYKQLRAKKDEHLSALAYLKKKLKPHRKA